MNILKLTKNLIVLFLSVSIFVIPILNFCALPVYSAETIYDFSDDAQIRFDEMESAKKENKSNDTVIKVDPKLESVKTKKVKSDTKSSNTLVFDEDEIQNMLSGELVFVKQGAKLRAVLQSSINSGSLDDNDTIVAILEEDWVYKNYVLAPKGSLLYGHAFDTKKAGLLCSNGQMSITFNNLLTPKGDKIALTSNVVTLKGESKRAMQFVKHVAGGAIAGLVTGVLYTLISGGDVASGIAWGASVGAAGGVVSGTMQRGEDVEIPAGTVIDVTLTKSMNISPYMD